MSTPAPYLQAVTTSLFVTPISTVGPMRNNITFYTANPSSSYSTYYYTGMYATVGVAGVPVVGPQVLFYPSDGNTTTPGSLLSAPLELTGLWQYISGGSTYIYSIVPPDGYVALGSFASTSVTPSIPTQLMCVRQDLCHQVTLGLENLIWTDAFSTAGSHCSVWMLPNARTPIATVNLFAQPNPQATYTVPHEGSISASYFPYLAGDPASTPSVYPSNVVVWDLKQPPF